MRIRSPHFRMFSRFKVFSLAVIVAIGMLAVGFFTSNADTAPVGILTAAAKTMASGYNYDIFLKVDSIQGESTDIKHPGELEISSFAWGETRAMGTARPTMEGFRITLPLSKASPKLFLHTAGGLKISRMTLSVRQQGKQDDFLKWILTDSQIVSYKTVGNDRGDGVQDEILITPGKIEVEHRTADGAVTKAGWDQRTGKSVPN